MADLQLDLNQSLELRIAQFKNDPEKMQDVNDFLNELFKEAQKEVDQKNGIKSKGKLMARKGLGHHSVGHARLPGPLQQGSSQLYATAPIK